MGQKVNPIAIRLAISKYWRSQWFGGKNMAKNLIEDTKLRSYIESQVGEQGGIDKIIIKRGADDIEVDIFTSKPGVIIGRQGAGITKLQKQTSVRAKKPVKINIMEVRKPDLSARLVATNIGFQVAKRLPYRRAVKQAIERVMQSGALGVKIVIAGRLSGTEIARREKFGDGSVPTNTLEQDIDFYTYHANTTYGVIGIKVWINKGKIKQGESDADSTQG